MSISSTFTQFANLFSELQQEIYQRMDSISLKNFALTNKHFNIKARVNTLWQVHLNEIFPKIRDRVDIKDDYAYHKLFVNEKRNETINIIEFDIRKLFVLVEENNIEEIRKVIQKTELKITDILHTKKRLEKKLATFINEQNDQRLRDCFFQFVDDEYNDPHKLEFFQRPAPDFLDSFAFFDSSTRKIIKQSENPLKKRDIEGFILFHWACIFGQKTFLNREDILEISPDTAQGVRPCNSALSIAILHGSMDGTQYLIDRDANINKENLEGGDRGTPVYFAATSAHFPALEILLSKSNARQFIPKNLLYDAAYFGQADSVKYLLETFPDLFHADEIKKATLTADHMGYPKTLEYLYPFAKQHDLQANDLLKEIGIYFVNPNWECDLIGCLKFILKEKADIDSPFFGSHENQTLLHEAVRESNNEVVEFLVLNGAKIEIMNDRNETPLEVAVRRNRMEIVKFLINHGASITQKILTLVKNSRWIDSEISNLILSLS